MSFKTMDEFYETLAFWTEAQCDVRVEHHDAPTSRLLPMPRLFVREYSTWVQVSTPPSRLRIAA